MTDDLRARIARALRDHDANMDGGNPAHEADGEYGCCAEVVMSVVQPEFDRGILDYLRTHPEHTAELMRAEMLRLSPRNRPTPSEEGAA